MVARKHKEPLKLWFNSGFYITTNEYPDFGLGVDSVAIRKRLSVFLYEGPSKKGKQCNWLVYSTIKLFV